MTSLLHLFQWLGETPVGVLIRDTKWGFAIVEMVHLVALALVGGTVLILDLRLMGWGLGQTRLSELARELRPWFLTGLTAIILSGIVLVSGEAMKCFYHPAFRWKMALLAAAILFYATVHRRAAYSPFDKPTTASRVVAAISLSLWLGVGVAGRAIGLL